MARALPQRREDSRRDWTWPERALIGTGIVIAVIGLVLVFTASLDDAARSNLGVGLLTTVVVGGALLAFERTLARREARLEQQRLRRDLDGDVEADLASLCTSHTWSLWLQMAQAEPAFSEHIAGMPSGWRGPDDFAAVHRALLWLRERMERDKEWWRHSYLLACADALTFVVTDLLERIGIAADEDELSGATQLTASRLAITAQRASIAGDIEYARRIDAIADALASGVTPAFVPDLPDVTNREGIHIIGGAFADLRLQVAWLVEELRPSPLVLDAMGKPVDTGVGDAATYRWGLLLKDADDPSAVWDDRFADDSWFRRILTFAAKEIRLLFKLDRRDEV